MLFWSSGEVVGAKRFDSEVVGLQVNGGLTVSSGLMLDWQCELCNGFCFAVAYR